jgi:protein-S-isoprenylcysteine O-methyltransferase Ste14
MSTSSRLPTLGPRGEGWVVLQGVLLSLDVLAGVAGLAGIGGPIADGGSRLVLAVVGAGAMAAGGLLALRGGLDLRDSLTPLPHPRDGASLVETGVYRLVRHPIYGGVVIGALGWGLVTASAAAIVGAAVLLGFFRLKSGLEEVWLGQSYPSYAAYRTRTRRMLPFLY